jgi:hypothetical protein
VASDDGAGGTTPQDKGRFDGYDVMAQRKHWDEQTANLVFQRLNTPAELKFFTEEEAQTAGVLFDLILAQHEEPRVPVLYMVDARLHQGSTDGWRYQDMPEDSDAWRVSLAHLEHDAKDLYGCRFHELSLNEQGQLLQGVQDAEDWHGWPAKHVWSLWTRYACAAYFAHPWAWNEIGFGGPAYPRGYMVLRPGWREPWEKPERNADDPVPWAARAERAQRAHEARLGKPASGKQG